MDEAADICSRVFGYVGVSRALMVDKDMDVIRAETGNYLCEELQSAKPISFAIIS